MGVITETTHRGEFLVSEANGHRSRSTVTIASGENLEAGAVLGEVTADGTFKLYNPNNADGSETAVAVLYGAVDASDGEIEGVAIDNDAVVDPAMLTWFDGATDAEKTTGLSELRNVGIKNR